MHESLAPNPNPMVSSVQCVCALCVCVYPGESAGLLTLSKCPVGGDEYLFTNHDGLLMLPHGGDVAITVSKLIPLTRPSPPKRGEGEGEP